MATSTEAAKKHCAVHLQILVICAIALVGAPLLDVHANTRVAVYGVPSVVLPPTCFSREVFGVNCPGCGLTRSFVHLAHGDWRESLHCHRLGWLLMAAAAFQIPYRANLLWGNRRFELSNFVSKACSAALISALIVNWLIGVWMQRSV